MTSEVIEPSSRLNSASWGDLGFLADRLAARWAEVVLPGRIVQSVYGVPRGGIVPAVMVSERLGKPMVDEPNPGTLIVDDLIDSGATMNRYAATGVGFDALVRKPHSPLLTRASHTREEPAVWDGWIVFPWELGTDDATGPADAVVRLLEFVGEDPDRGGLIDTPDRVLRALAEMTAGYHDDPEAILSRTFDDRSDEMVILREVEFTSLCEHHLLPFTGTCTLGYIPTLRVVGLSKLARLVECFARRLQVQERMTTQIAQALQEHLDPIGVGVIVRARHSCMGCRGIKKPTAEMVTSAMLGALRDKPEARAEFLLLAGSR